ncbi:MAG TPA: hypothetical protein VGN14_03225 [Candidatus Elarobacter sp.]
MAFLLGPLILAYFGLLGTACAAAFNRRIPSAVLLTSPIIGVGIALPLALTLNRLGLPVASFALALTVSLGIVAALCLAWRRPQISWDEALALAPVMLAGMLLAGAPTLMYGFDWVGNANSDMGLYVNAAANFLRHGFFDVPDLATLASNADAARNAWFWEILPPNRYGADMLVALVAAVSHVSTYEIYMVVEIAAFGALVAATAAVVIDLGSRVRTYVSAALIAVASPLLMYVVYQQLLPQLLGQAAISAFVALVATGGAVRQRGVTIGCAGVALLLCYPETSPIVALGGAVTVAATVIARPREARRLAVAAIGPAAIAIATVLVLLNVQLFTVAATFATLSRIGGSVANEGVGAIIYYVIPSGLANLWGLVPFDDYGEPWVSISIVAGFAALVALFVAGFRSLRRARFADGMLVAILLFCLYLFARRSSYGLFKLAFLLQPFAVPFVAATIVSAGDLLRRRLRVRPPWGVAAALTTAIALTVYSTSVYLGSTSDAFARDNAKFTELHAATTHRLYRQLDAIERAQAPHVSFRTDVLLPNLATLEGVAFYGHPLSYVTLDPYENMYDAEARHRLAPAIVGWPSGERAEAFVRVRQRVALVPPRFVVVAGKPVAAYVPIQAAAAASDELIETGPNLTILNRSATRGRFDVRAVPWRDVHDRLALVKSDLGFPPLTRLRSFALGPVEPDPFDRANTVATVGNAMLLEVLRGGPAVRLRLDLTGTLNPDHVDDLPPITIVGASTQTIDGLGNGAARIVTEPIRPFTQFGHRYVVVRFGDRTLHFTSPRSWLMGMFGRDVDPQPRVFALYGRDISIDGEDPPPPSTLTTFPRDLFDPGLRFSGIYEDGWMSTLAHLRLRATSAAFFRLRANVPPNQPEHTIAVSIDGRPATNFIARPATYVTIQLKSPGSGDHEITIASSAAAAIGPADPRKVWGRIEEVGFAADIVGPGIDLVDENEWYPFETFDQRTFRWTKRVVRLRVGASASPRTLRLEVAPGPAPVDVTATVAGTSRRFRVEREQEIDLDLPPAAHPLAVVITRPAGRVATPGDPRDLALRVFSARLSAAGADRSP